MSNQIVLCMNNPIKKIYMMNNSNYTNDNTIEFKIVAVKNMLVGDHLFSI